MPKINVYLPDALAEAVRDAQVPVSAVCQAALERAVRDVASARAVEEIPPPDAPGYGLFGRFTPRARQALVLAEAAARNVPHNYVDTEHVLMGVLDEGKNLAVNVLHALGVEPDDLRAELAASFQPPTSALEGRLPFTPLATRSLELTAAEALTLGHNYVGCEHLLLGLLANEEGLASRVLRRMGLELRTTRRAVITALSGFAHAETRRAAQPGLNDTLDQILKRLDAIEQRLAS